MKLVSPNDPVLHTPAEEFDFVNPQYNLGTLIPELFDFMYDSNGVGIAAPQVGIPLRIFVIDVHGVKYTCINPTMLPLPEIDKSTPMSVEGCLSYPGLRLRIPRAQVCRMKWFDESQEPQDAVFSFETGRVFQHEYDHIEGITFDTRVSKLKLDMAKKKLRKVY